MIDRNVSREREREREIIEELKRKERGKNMVWDASITDQSTEKVQTRERGYQKN